MADSVTGLRRRDPADAADPFGRAARGQGLVIAVDGPSGSGKSSAARGAAIALGLRYLDTGAMYRAVTWWMLEHDVDLADADAVGGYAERLAIEISTDPGDQRVRVDGIDVTTQIRNRRVSNVVSLVAAVPRVRTQLRAQQRALIAGAVTTTGGILAEGRDIGTVVAPDAALKVFLTASEQARAERRAAELSAAEPPSVGLTLAEQARRDRRDAPQTRKAADAVEIDATDLTLHDVIAQIVELVKARRGA